MRSKYGKRGVPRALRKPAHSDDRPGGSGMRDGGDGRSRASDRYQERPALPREDSPEIMRSSDDGRQPMSVLDDGWRDANTGADDRSDERREATVDDDRGASIGRTPSAPVQVYRKPRRSVQVPRDGPDGGG